MTSSNAICQDADYKKNFRKALAYFNNENFREALPIFLMIDSIGPESFETKYYIGACYLNTNNEQAKGIPYLEYAQKHGESFLPKAVLVDLGRLYHLNGQFEQAVHQFERYLKLSDKKDYNETYVKRMIEICSYARDVVKDTLNVEIINLGKPVNSNESEVLPYVNADETILFFTRHFIKRFKGLEIDTLTKIMYSENRNGEWVEPAELLLPKDISYSAISLCGISADGQELFFSLKAGSSYDLFYGKVENNKVLKFIPFPETVNSIADEKSCSITPDGQVLYFSSNRTGGYGGFDIYRSQKTENGQWGEAVNIGVSVNTEYDDISPFIHPDSRTLFFASNGHNTIGGFDIFISVCDNNCSSWTVPRNAGCPINTTYNDQFFIVMADGNHAYFSSAKGNANGNHDIYKAILHQSIPLTLIKGTITGGTPAKPVNARIRVIDKETGQKLKYVYNPNPISGKYLMIFPPNKKYEMIIESDDYFPNLIEISVPDQTYFYEMFQEIHLDKITVGGNKELGQEITVRNIFYDVYKDKADTIFKLNDTTAEKRYEKLLNIIENIIETSDSLGQEKLERFSEEYINKTAVKDKNLDNLLNLIEQAIESTDSTMLTILDQTAIYHERTRKVYFYDALNNKPDMNFILLDSDTVWTLPSLNTEKDILPDAEKKPEKIEKIIQERPPDWEKMSEKKLVYDIKIYFDPLLSFVKPEYLVSMSEIVRLMLDNRSLVIIIEGYTDTRGDEKKNLDLSNERAMNVLKYFLDNYIPTQRVRITGYGESRSAPEKTESEFRENRRVEVKLYEPYY